MLTISDHMRKVYNFLTKFKFSSCDPFTICTLFNNCHCYIPLK